MKGQTFDFAEGTMTIREFKERHASCLPEATIRLHLKAGRNSAHAMLTFSAASKCKASGRLGQKRHAASLAKVRFGKSPGRLK